MSWNKICNVCNRRFLSRGGLAVCEPCRTDPDGRIGLRLVMDEPHQTHTPVAAERLIEEWQRG